MGRDVREAEVKCYEYLLAIRDVSRFSGQGIYGLDANRERIHDEICKLMGLPKDFTYQFTNDVSKYEDGSDLYFAILKEARKQKLVNY